MTRSPRVDGLLVVDKPQGKTSHDIVSEARRVFHTRAVGHAGTLDPMATGVLVLLCGEACKLASHLTGQDKTYRARVRFGIGTHSLDADGEVTERAEVPDGLCTDGALERALATEAARELQVPPNVSAIREAGERAHVRARRGEAFALPARPVQVRSLTVLGTDRDSVELEVCVSKGYYVRSLARDLGAALGVPAHLAALRRLRSGPFALSEAVSWPPERAPWLTSCAEAATRALPITRLTAEGVRFARQGKRLTHEQAFASALETVSAWLTPLGELVALGESAPDGTHRVLRGFNPLPAAV
jgi:tRNA pseudouridine55 synthase